MGESIGRIKNTRVGIPGIHPGGAERLHHTALGRFQMGHDPTCIGRLKETDQLQERRDKGVVEIHHHHHGVARATGVFHRVGRGRPVPGIAVAIGAGAGFTLDRFIVRIGIRRGGGAAGADCYLQKARLGTSGNPGGDIRILLVQVRAGRQQTGQIPLGLVVDGRDARIVLHGFILGRLLTGSNDFIGDEGRVHLAGDRGNRIILGIIDGTMIIWISIGTVGRVVTASGGITDGLAGDVLDQQPGRKQQREINDGEQQHQQDRGSQRKLDHALRTAGTPPEAFSIAWKICSP